MPIKKPSILIFLLLTIVASPLALINPVRADVSIWARDRELQKNAARFRLLQPNLHMKGVKFVKLSLNQNPVKIGKMLYDGFSFCTPPGKAQSLFWAFTLPAELKEWYILPEKGGMIGFTGGQSASLPNDLVYGKAHPSASEYTSGVIQGLDAKFLRPNTRYLIWFKFEKKRPVSISVSLNLVPFDLRSLMGKKRLAIHAILGRPLRTQDSTQRVEEYHQFASYGLQKVEFLYTSPDDADRLTAIVVRFFPRYNDLDWDALLKIVNIVPESVDTDPNNNRHTITGPDGQWEIIYAGDGEGNKFFHFQSSQKSH